MDWMEMGQTIFNVVLIPLLIVATNYLVKYIKVKCDSLTAQTDNDLFVKYLTMLQETVVSCVLATTQTYVESMKNKNAFNEEAQRTAFKMSFDAVMAILSDEAKEYLQNVLGDLNKYVTDLIEAEVRQQKA